jgi:hypothetical protein
MLQPPPSAKVMAGKERFDMTSPRDSMGGFDWPSRTIRGAAIQEEEPEHISKETEDGTVDTTGMQQQLPRRPSLSRVRTSFESDIRDDFDQHRDSRSDSMFSVADDQSFSTSWKYPDTPATRPASNSTEGSIKAPRPQISKTLSTLKRDDGNKHKVHLLQLEINDDRDEFGVGQLERIRPWRWSMDI